MRKMKYMLLTTFLLTSGMFTSCSKNNGSILIVGVNFPEFEEIRYLVDHLTNKQTSIIANQTFYTGSINNRRVIIAESGVGVCNASIITTIGINHFHPQYVINEGSSGGHVESLNVNDIILGETMINMASYVGDPYHPESWELTLPYLHSDTNLLNKALSVPYQYGNRRLGTISTSDSWNTGVEFINTLHAKFGEDCEEMESYAVANVCDLYNVPHLSIRAISNNAVSGAEYSQDAGLNCQKYTLDVIKAL